MKKIILYISIILALSSCSSINKQIKDRSLDTNKDEINTSNGGSRSNDKDKAKRLEDNAMNADSPPEYIIEKDSIESEDSLDISINNFFYLANWINNLDEDLQIPDHRRNKWGWYSNEYDEFSEKLVYEFYNDDIVIDIGAIELVDYQESYGENVFAITLDVMVENISDQNLLINGTNSSIYLASDIEYDCYYDESINTANQKPADINAFQMVFPIDDFREYNQGFVIDFYYSNDEFDKDTDELRHLYLLINVTDDDQLEVGSFDLLEDAIKALEESSNMDDFKIL